MSLRRIVSLSLMLSIVTMLTSSIILYIVPQGRVAFWSDWTLWGLGKHQWGALHTNLGLFMMIAALLHLYYNWRPVTSYMKNKARAFRMFTPNFNVALAVVGVFVGLTLLGQPPMAWIQDLRETLEAGAVRKLGEPPYGHAELSGLRVFLRNVDLDPARARANLAAAGITVEDPEVVLADLARANGLSPQALYQIMLGPVDRRPTAALPIPATMPKGSGRLTLEAFCGNYNRDPAAAVAILEEAGLTVDPTLPLKDIAAANGREPLDLLDILRQGFLP